MVNYSEVFRQQYSEQVIQIPRLFKMSDIIQPIFPATSANIQLKAEGVFAFPDEWRTTDEANPGMFTYIVKFANTQIANGKVYPRELTEKQLREQESKKKGGKKDGKKEENPAEAEKLKELQEKQEQEERKKLQEWNKMSQQEQFYSASEDCYKSALLKFDPNNTDIRLSGKAFVAFEEHVVKDGGQWAYVIKMPTANQQELAKLKKAKPKTLANANDLNPVVMRAWVDLSCINSDSIKQATVRCNLEQVDATDDSPKPNLDKAYVKLHFSFAQPLIKKVDSNNSKQMIKDPAKPPEVSKDVKCVQDLREQIKIALESLAMEYSAMFEKELNMMQEQKTNQIFINSRKNQPARRKQQFLYDFNISGKYRVLKERLKKAIVSLCENKFRQKMNGAKSFTGVTCSMRDQFYSQIYDFLVTEYSQTMFELVEEKKQILNQVYVLKREYQQKMSQQYLQSFIQESREQRLQRIIYEYLQVGNAAYGADLYQKQIQKYPQDISLKYQYALYCIRNGLKSVKNVIAEGYIEKYIEIHKEEPEARMTYVLLMIASEVPSNLNRAWVVLRQIIENDKKNVMLLLIAAVLFEILKNQQNSKIYFTRASREKLRKLEKIKEQGKHKEDPQASEIPSFTSLATYAEELSNEEQDQLWSTVLSKFSELGLMNIVEIIKAKLSNQESIETQKQNLNILKFQGKYQQCQEEAVRIFKETNDIDVFNILILSLTKLNNLDETEKYLKFGLKVAPEQEKINILLKLGYIYLKAQKYGNAKACLVKYLEKIKKSGGLSWQILGTAELKTGKYNEAIKCFRFSNLSDPYNPDVWISLARAYAGQGNLVMVNQCLNSFEGDKEKLSQIANSVQQVPAQNFYSESMKAKFSLKFQGE